MGKTTFWFATFEIENVTRDVTDFDPSQSRENIVRESLQSYVRSEEPVSEDSDGQWYFGAIDDREDIIYGKFGKEFTADTSEYDEAEGDFVDDVGLSTDAQYSMFILHIPMRLIIYNTKSRVGHQQFRKHFAKGYSLRQGGEMTTEFLKNTADLETVISQFRVRNAEFELHPSNPSAGPEWEALDDRIKEMVAETLDIEVEAMEGSGINFDEEFLAQVTSMAQSDYGEFKVFYDEDGFVKKITSGEGEPIAKRETEPDNLGDLRAIGSQFIEYASTFLD